MLLWSIQSDEVYDALCSAERLSASWESVYSRWRVAYRWIAGEMSARHVQTGGAPPTWAWHSCGGCGRSPDEETLVALLGGQAGSGKTLVLDVPDELAVLTRYGYWNDLLVLCDLPLADRDLEELICFQEGRDQTHEADSAAIMSSEADSPDEFLQPPIEGAAAQLVERLRKWRILDEHSQ